MKYVRETPKDWEKWLKRVGITQNYIFYEYSRKKNITGYCTWCEKNVVVNGVKHNRTWENVLTAGIRSNIRQWEDSAW